jgi:hypothetical protein
VHAYETCKSRDSKGQSILKQAFANASEKAVSPHPLYVNRPEQIIFVTFEADTFEQIDNLFNPLLKRVLGKNNLMITRDVANHLLLWLQKT